MYEVVVGIDFGSSGSGFAYSFYNKNDINHGIIYGSNVDNKVPTEIILDEQNTILRFGAECKQYLKEKGIKSGNYFKDIKIQLYNKNKFIKAKNSGKKLPLKLVIQKILEKLKELAINEIKSKKPLISESKIKWVVTVPAIWGENEKGVMMEACIEAGLIDQKTDKSLFFSLEPEAASLYCLNNGNIDKTFFKEGEYYIICDLGGGTGDIVAHLVGSNENLSEIHPACGGIYGSNEIDRLIFENIIYSLFGCKNFRDFLSKYKIKDNEKVDEGILFNDWCELEREIKDFKEGTNNININNNEKFPINFSLFQDIFDENIDLNDLVDKYNQNIIEIDLKINVRSKRKWILEFPYKIVYKYINQQANSICEIIKNIHTKNNEDIKTLILVGGYSSNEVLVSLIKKYLSNILYILRPTKPSLAIMEGAVIFGMNPYIIMERKAKYTIGTSFCDKWDESKHSKRGKKLYNSEAGIWECINCFSKFITINQDIKLNDVISNSYCMIGKRKCLIKFYKSKKINPIFTFEEGIELIGECELDSGKDYNSRKERIFVVNLKFGGTFIDVNAIHLKSGKNISAKFNFT